MASPIHSKVALMFHGSTVIPKHKPAPARCFFDKGQRTQEAERDVPASRLWNTLRAARMFLKWRQRF